uniref:Reelin domain-containing protein n=1 Tax=Oryzias latipes TaxID=8090 RepID=A0A3P9LFD9_ORYLA
MASLLLLPTLAAVVCLLIKPIASFSHGASHRSCLKMIPGHIQAHPLDPKHSHVTIHTSSSLYWPGQLITVTVRSSRDFMGFLLQARSVGASAKVVGGASIRSKRLGPILVGGCWILTPPSTHTLHCMSDGDTVTHSDKQLKRNLSFVWRAPDAPMGDVRFHITVVQSYFVYWAGIESAVVHDGSRVYWRAYNITVRDGEKTFAAQTKNVTVLPAFRATRVSVTTTNTTFSLSSSVTHSTISTNDTLKTEGSRLVLELNSSVALTSHGVIERTAFTPTSPHNKADSNDPKRNSQETNYETGPKMKETTFPESTAATLLTFQGFHGVNTLSSSVHNPRTSTQVPKTSWTFRNQNKTKELYGKNPTGSQTAATEASSHSSQHGFPSFLHKPHSSISAPTSANRQPTVRTLHQLETSPTEPKSSSERASWLTTKTTQSTSTQPRSSSPIQTQSFVTFYPLNPPIFTLDKGLGSQSKVKSSDDLHSSPSSFLHSSVLQSTETMHLPPSGSHTLVSTPPSVRPTLSIHFSSLKSQPETVPALSALPIPSPVPSLHLPLTQPPSTSPPPSFYTSPTPPLRSQNSPATVTVKSPFTGPVCSSSLKSPNSSSPSVPPSATPRSITSSVTPPSRLYIPPSTSSSFKEHLSFTSVTLAASGLNPATLGTIVHPNPKPFPNHRLDPGHDLLPDVPIINSKPKRPSKPQTPGEDGKYPDIVPKHTAWELGVLLGGSAGFGMVLVLAVRCLYHQACGRRTEVTLNDREREYGRGEIGLIQVQECGDLVRVRKIRENSFVFLTEYDVLATSGN